MNQYDKDNVRDLAKQLFEYETAGGFPLDDPAEAKKRSVMGAAAANMMEMLARIEKVQEALSRHPNVCDKWPEDDVVACGWKRVVKDVQDTVGRLE